MMHRMKAGRHAKRTTVYRYGPGWRIDFATFDRPARTETLDRDEALDVAQRFEQAKARARFIEANRPRGWVEPIRIPEAESMDDVG